MENQIIRYLMVVYSNISREQIFWRMCRMDWLCVISTHITCFCICIFHIMQPCTTRTLSSQ
ncbi:hypothetical protein WUBG_15709, partial [Wuchereria bancrofti]